MAMKNVRNKKVF